MTTTISRTAREALRPGGHLVAATALVGGSMLALGGVAQALPPEADECATTSDEYTVAVGGSQGCTPPISEAEAECYEGAAVGAAAGSLAGPSGALASGAGGCVNSLRE